MSLTNMASCWSPKSRWRSTASESALRNGGSAALTHVTKSESANGKICAATATVAGGGGGSVPRGLAAISEAERLARAPGPSSPAVGSASTPVTTLSLTATTQKNLRGPQKLALRSDAVESDRIGRETPLPHRPPEISEAERSRTATSLARRVSRSLAPDP